MQAPSLARKSVHPEDINVACDGVANMALNLLVCHTHLSTLMGGGEMGPCCSFPFQ
uniref:Uncharacterized protein n=1 Tax=Anguilla anguilla TaxID=7936 RepID=A0A0E9QWC8_ANGAN